MAEMGKSARGMVAGPFEGPPHELDSDRAVRAKSLELAVKTVENVRDFTNFQVVNTAALYEDYIANGTVPQISKPGEPEPIPDDEEPDAQV